MRENQNHRASLEALKSTYEINGLNLDRFINIVKKRGIALYNVKKLSNKRLIVSVSLKESKKFFAIAKELCYNIKKIRDGGTLYPLLKLYRSLGIVFGAIIISISAVYCDGLIFSFSYSGSGSVYKREVQEYLADQGINKFTKFSDVNMQSLEDGILAFNPHLSFVSCRKSGSVLKIELALSTEKVDRLDGKVYALYSDVDGVVESVKVYRGTSVVTVGQAVRQGDLLVDGVMVIKEQEINVNVLACVTIVSEKNFEYRSRQEGEEEKALLLAEQQYDDLTAIESDVSVKQSGEDFVYKVTLKCRRVLHAG